MTDTLFGRTGERVARVWHERADGSVAAGDWTGLVVSGDDLDRRGGGRIRDRAALLGRAFDFLLVRDVLANDLKVGWPLHKLQRLRDERLLRYVVVETHDPLEAEWIAANAPVHGVVVVYSAADMAARFRAFDAARAGGVALIGRAEQDADVALQRGTPAIDVTLLAPGVSASPAMPADQAEAMWADYAASHAPPPKLRSGHPPDFGT